MPSGIQRPASRRWLSNSAQLGVLRLGGHDAEEAAPIRARGHVTNPLCHRHEIGTERALVGIREHTVDHRAERIATESTLVGQPNGQSLRLVDLCALGHDLDGERTVANIGELAQCRFEDLRDESFTADLRSGNVPCAEVTGKRSQNKATRRRVFGATADGLGASQRRVAIDTMRPFPLLLALPLLAACKRPAATTQEAPAAKAVKVQTTSAHLKTHPPGFCSQVGISKRAPTRPISPNVSGRVVVTKVERGSRVKAGDPIATVDVRAAALSAAEARAQAENAKAQADAAKLNCDRAQALGASGSISKAELDRLEAQCRSSASWSTR